MGLASKCMMEWAATPLQPFSPSALTTRKIRSVPFLATIQHSTRSIMGQSVSHIATDTKDT